MVSILIPAYNAGPWIRQCVESALTQTYGGIEVIVADDGSTDGTVEAVREFGGRVRLAEGTHAGGNAARNRLLELARGEWLQYLDADDYLLPEKIARQMERADAEPELDIVYSPVILRDENAGTERVLEMDGAADAALHYIRWGALNTNGFLWRRAALTEIGGWKKEQPACQEHELLLRAMEAGKRFGLVNQAGAVYRLHRRESVSRKDPLLTIRLQAELLDRMEEHLRRRGELTARHRKELFATRMEAARTAWKTDQAAARRLAAKAAAGGNWWVKASPAVPASFQIAARVLGFAGAERRADKRRG